MKHGCVDMSVPIPSLLGRVYLLSDLLHNASASASGIAIGSASATATGAGNGPSSGGGGAATAAAAMHVYRSHALAHIGELFHTFIKLRCQLCVRMTGGKISLLHFQSRVLRVVDSWDKKGIFPSDVIEQLRGCLVY